MTTRINPKILIPFVVTPILSLVLFFVMYVAFLKYPNDLPSSGVLFFVSLFGVLGIWLVLTVILRAKKISIENDQVIVTRYFVPQEFRYRLSEIQTYSISKHLSTFNEYRVLQFQTIDDRVHSVVSNEVKGFNVIYGKIKSCKSERIPFKMNEFLLNEYLPAFLVAMLIVFVLYIPIMF
jgi:hypothetical protein